MPTYVMPLKFSAPQPEVHHFAQAPGFQRERLLDPQESLKFYRADPVGFEAYHQRILVARANTGPEEMNQREVERADQQIAWYAKASGKSEPEATLHFAQTLPREFTAYRLAKKREAEEAYERRAMGLS